MIRPALRLASLCALLFALSACGESGTDPDDGELTEAELDALLEVMVLLSDIGLGAVSEPAASPAAVPETFTIQSTSLPCPDGGAVVVSGSATADEEVGEIEMDLTMTHQACRATAESSGRRQFTLNGSPNVDYYFFLALFDEGEFEMEVDQVGAIQWVTGGRSGLCEIDVHLEVTGDLDIGAISGTVSGSLCGVSVNSSVSS